MADQFVLMFAGEETEIPDLSGSGLAPYRLLGPPKFEPRDDGGHDLTCSIVIPTREAQGKRVPKAITLIGLAPSFEIRPDNLADALALPEEQAPRFTRDTNQSPGRHDLFVPAEVFRVNEKRKFAVIARY